MARAPRSTGREVAPKDNKTTAVANWEERLEREAEAAAGMERGAGVGKNFSFKGGVLSFDGAPIKGNKIPVIVAAGAIEKAYYEGRYDADNPEPPVCYAHGFDPEEMAPKPEEVADLKSDTCAECPFNQWGSADTGRGKACKDVRRLALLPAGSITTKGDVELFDTADAIKKAEFGFAKLPPTSLNAYAKFVRSCQAVKRPPHGVFALMEVLPDNKNQFTVTFEILDLIDKKLMGAVFERYDEALPLVQQPYTYPSEAEKAERKKQSRGGARQGASGGRAAGGRGAAKPRGRKY